LGDIVDFLYSMFPVTSPQSLLLLYTEGLKVSYPGLIEKIVHR